MGRCAHPVEGTTGIGLRGGRRAFAEYQIARDERHIGGKIVQFVLRIDIRWYADVVVSYFYLALNAIYHQRFRLEFGLFLLEHHAKRGIGWILGRVTIGGST